MQTIEIDAVDSGRIMGLAETVHAFCGALQMKGIDWRPEFDSILERIGETMADEDTRIQAKALRAGALGDEDCRRVFRQSVTCALLSMGFLTLRACAEIKKRGEGQE